MILHCRDPSTIQAPVAAVPGQAIPLRAFSHLKALQGAVTRLRTAGCYSAYFGLAYSCYD
jgi:hypothetical protein